MDLLASLLREQAPQLVSALTQKTDLSPDEAERLVPEGAEATVAALKQSEGLDFGDLLAGGNLSALLGKIDVASLARRAGIGEPTAAAGLQTIVPAVLGLLQSKGGGIEGVQALLGAQGSSGILSQVGKLAGKLFRK
jgi:hypothetical protein